MLIQCYVILSLKAPNAPIFATESSSDSSSDSSPERAKQPPARCLKSNVFITLQCTKLCSKNIFDAFFKPKKTNLPHMTTSPLPCPRNIFVHIPMNRGGGGFTYFIKGGGGWFGVPMARDHNS